MSEPPDATGSVTREHVFCAPDYGEFRRRLQSLDCQDCALGATRRNIVVDRGEETARVLLIGEAPGAEEDARGQAFVGRSGRLLDEMLCEAGWNPKRDILIANVAKCRPPENRAPHRDEVAACIPYLHRQVELLRPSAVVLLGGTAIRHVLPEHSKTAVTKLAGRALESSDPPGVRFFATFHPAYILRSRSKRPEMVRHLEQVRASL